MNRLLSSVESAPRVSNSVGPLNPGTAVPPRDHGHAPQVAALPRNDVRRGSSYVGKSYLTGSRRSSAGRPLMFRIS